MILLVITAHRSPFVVQPVWAQIWARCHPAADTLFLWGGPPAAFPNPPPPGWHLVDDPALRRTPYQRAKRSRTALFRAVANFLAHRPNAYEWVALVDYDLLPLRPDVLRWWVDQAEAAASDAVLPCLQRVDGTTHALWQFHRADPQLAALWPTAPDAAEPIVFWAHAAAQLWRPAVVADLAAQPEPFPIHHELYLPTKAWQRGWRLSPLDPNCDHALRWPTSPAAAHAAGLPWVHPQKHPPHLWPWV